MKKGFTIVELLAVITILAIIALIAVPIVLNIIEDTKEETNEISMQKYGEAVEIAISIYKMKNNKYPTNFSQFENYIEYSGSSIECSIKTLYEDKTFYLGDCIVNESEEKYSYTNKKYKDGDIIYFDVLMGKSCTNYHKDNSITGYNGLETTKTTNNQNSCLKFYAFNDNGGTRLNLLLDHNTTAYVAWDLSGSNSDGPKEVINSLYNDTKEWMGTETPNNYEYKGTPTYTINYTGYKARIITAQEVAQITGADKALNWKEESSTNHYYLDGSKGTDSTWLTQIANSTNLSEYYWLFDRTSNCKVNGCETSDSLTNGYWTSSAQAGNTTRAWRIDSSGSLVSVEVNMPLYAGIRPVIEVLKSNM